MRDEQEDGTSFAPNALDKKSCCVWEGKMTVVAVFSEGKSGLSTCIPRPTPTPTPTPPPPHPRRAGRALPGYPLASCLWLSHSDGCSLGSCAITRVLAGK